MCEGEGNVTSRWQLHADVNPQSCGQEDLSGKGLGKQILRPIHLVGSPLIPSSAGLFLTVCSVCLLSYSIQDNQSGSGPTQDLPT